MGCNNSKSWEKKELKWAKKQKHVQQEHEESWTESDEGFIESLSELEDECVLQPFFQVLETPSTSSLRRVPADKLPSVVEAIAAHMRAEHLLLLDSALQIRNSDKEKILNMFPGQVQKHAAVLMYSWLLSQPHPRAEKLLWALREVGLNYDWVLDEVLLDPVLSAGGADGPQQQPEVKVKEKKDKETQTEQPAPPKRSSGVSRSVAETQTDSEQVAVEAWTRAELWTLLQTAPDPIMVPVDFQRWLRQICVLYEPRPSEIRKLLKLAYKSEWKNAEQYFELPGGNVDPDWPSADAMTAWLDGVCMSCLLKVSWNNEEFVSSTACRQKPNEKVSDFVVRFQRMAESKYDPALHATPGFSVVNLVHGLQPHVEEVFTLQRIGWIEDSFVKVKHLLEAMEERGMFEPQDLAIKHQADLESVSSDESEPPSYDYPRWVRRRGACYSCGQMGHWRRDCRAESRRCSRQPALQWY